MKKAPIPVTPSRENTTTSTLATQSTTNTTTTSTLTLTTTIVKDNAVKDTTAFEKEKKLEL